MEPICNRQKLKSEHSKDSKVNTKIKKIQLNFTQLTTHQGVTFSGSLEEVKKPCCTYSAARLLRLLATHLLAGAAFRPALLCSLLATALLYPVYFSPLLCSAVFGISIFYVLLE